MAPSSPIISRHTTVVVEEAPLTGQRCLRSVAAFKTGAVIAEFKAGSSHPSATYLTVQKKAGLHITLSPSFLQYVNHSCAPNAFFDTDAMQFIALKNIAVGDELCFFYPSTEWQMAQPFACLCGSGVCLHTVQGAYYLADNVLEKYKLTSFIKEMQRLRNEAAVSTK